MITSGGAILREGARLENHTVVDKIRNSKRTVTLAAKGMILKLLALGAGAA